jgi:hypothetical protein
MLGQFKMDTTGAYSQMVSSNYSPTFPQQTQKKKTQKLTKGQRLDAAKGSFSGHGTFGSTAPPHPDIHQPSQYIKSTSTARNNAQHSEERPRTLADTFPPTQSGFVEMLRCLTWAGQDRKLFETAEERDVRIRTSAYDADTTIKANITTPHHKQSSSPFRAHVPHSNRFDHQPMQC